MLFHDALCVCFVALLVPNLETNAKLDSKTVNPETLFADVIKNISRVNNELQSLINNYEQFKRTHDSQESFDVKKEYVSDAEGGRVDRNSKNHKRNPSDKATTNSYHTEVIYEEEQADKNSGATQSSEEEKSIHAQPSSEAEQSHEEKSKKPTEDVDQKKQILTTTTEASVSNEEPTIESLNDDETGRKNQEFLLIHQNMKSETNRLKRIQSEAYLEPNNTKYVENEKQTKYLQKNAPQPSESDKSAESEQKTDEREKVVVIKPQERALEDKQGAFTAGIYLRSLFKKNATTTKKPLNGSSESSDIDEDLSKEVFKTRVLRQAYGDACLKVVVRKCYKACKLASVYTCRAAIKCKSEFKSYFKEKAKAECLDEFNAKSLRRITGPERVNGEIMTQEGYLSVACQTPLPQRRLLKPLYPVKNQTEPVNILRDRYERECAKISRNKCTTACHNSVEKTCEKYECNKRTKTNFKKNCKTTCKKFYSSKSKSSKSDSDDDSDDGSDDDSDDDSDTDSDDGSDDDSDDDSFDDIKKDDKRNGSKKDES